MKKQNKENKEKLEYVEIPSIDEIDEIDFDETLWETIKFEVQYKWNEFTSKIRNIKKGFRNIFRYWKLIWNDEWWDYQYLMNLIHFKLVDMEQNWDKSWGCDAEVKREKIKELIEILDEIKRLEDEDFTEFDFGEDTDEMLKQWEIVDNKIDALYQEFGEKLFSVKDQKTVNCDGEVENEYKSSTIRIFWD